MFQEAPAATGQCGRVEMSTALSSVLQSAPGHTHTRAAKRHPTRATHPFSNNPPVMAAALQYAMAQARTAGECWVVRAEDTSHEHSNTREQRGVNPHLLTQNRIPNNSACPQRVCVSNKLIRPLSAREELTNTPLPAVDKLSLLEQNPH